MPVPRLLALLAPLRTWSRAQRLAAVAAFTLLTTAFAVCCWPLFGPMFIQPDAPGYLLMAQGKSDQVGQPFVSRQLSVLLVRGLARVLHSSIQTAFIVEGFVCIVVIAAVIFILATRTAAPRWLLVTLVMVSFWPLTYVSVALPDPTYTALLCVLLLLLRYEQILPAAVMMFPLMLARESTSMTLVCFLIVAWKPLKWPGRILAIASAAAGSLVVGHLVGHNARNAEHLPQMVYLLAKVPWNFVRSLGAMPYSNLYAVCEQPKHVWAIHLGPLHTLGICSYSLSAPLNLVLGVLTGFGLLPLLLAFVWWHGRHNAAAESSVLLRFSLVYGMVCLVLVPLLGTAYTRFFGYTWPLALVALPLLFNRLPENWWSRVSPASVVAILLLHAGVLVTALRPYSWGELPVDLALFAAAYFLLRGWFSSPLATTA